MKIKMKNLIVFICFLLLPILLLAQVNSNHVYVNGYYRSNGTYVEGHYRTAPNSTNRDNFSTKGNVNPYTGKPGWITPDNNTYNYNYSNTYSKPSYNASNTYNSQYSSNPTYNSTSSSNYSYKTEWTASSTGYNFYFKGNNVSTTNEWRGNDLVVYYDNYAYLLPDYEENKDGIKREPVPLATWKSLADSYFFYYNEKSIANETTNNWFGDDLMVYNGNHAYLLEDYKFKKDGKIRLARNIPTWKYDGKSYYFYVDGKSVANETENLNFGNDLLVEYKENVYLLPNFFNETNSNLKTAIELPKWKSTGNSYYFYINENSVADKTRNEWLNENLIVYYGNSGYILVDYKNQKDGKLRVALPIPTWSSEGDSYYFYLNGESIADKTTNKWNGNDLIVTYQGKNYILPNYKNLKDGKVRFAKYSN